MSLCTCDCHEPREPRDNRGTVAELRALRREIQTFARLFDKRQAIAERAGDGRKS